MITIIGAGPVGCYTAYLLAKAGKEVQVFEEHNAIGKPVQCTGIVTGEINKIISLNEDIITNRVDKVRVFSKNNFTEIELDEIIIDRERFDEYLAEMAIKAGARVFLNSTFIDYYNNYVEVMNGNGIRRIKTDILIGADGVSSAVGRLINNKKGKYYVGIQARARLKNDGKSYETYFGFIPDFFAWVVPENNKIARIGVASKDNANSYFNKFLENKKIKGRDIIEKQGGLIPIFDSDYNINKKNIYLVGDAALQVKATTGGGLVPGLRSAEILADCIINNKDYKKGFNKKIGKELKLSLVLRRILNKFNDKDYNYLIKLMNKNRIKNILKDYNRDRPSKLLFKLIMSELRFLFFIKKLL